MHLPTHIDARGKRWALLTAAHLARMLPGATAWCVEAEQLTLPRRSPRRVRELLRELATTSSDAQAPSFYLRGDEHHLNDFYDVTEHVASAVAPHAGRGAWRHVDRFLGREIVLTRCVRSVRPTLWTSELKRLARLLAPEIDADGLLLGADWHPPYQPESPSWPWDPAVGSAIGDRLPWLFVEGQPSAEVRLRAVDVLAERACAGLREMADALPRGLMLASGMPMAPRRPWLTSPKLLAASGILPVLDASGCSADDIGRPEAALRVAEMAAAGAGEVAPHALLPDADTAAGDILRSWGLSPLAGPSRPGPTPPPSGRIEPAAIVVKSREDGWSYAWNEPTEALTGLAAQAVSVLVRRGIPCVVTDERGLLRYTDRGSSCAVILAPARTVRASTVELLDQRIAARHAVIVVEPAPHLVDGEHSERLERLLVHRRIRRVGERPPELERDLVEALHKARIDGLVRLFRRHDGLAPRDVRQTALRDGTRLFVTAMHGEDAAIDCLLEVRGQYSLERREGEDWTPWEHWHANGNTYAEVEAHPHVAYSFRLDPIETAA